MKKILFSVVSLASLTQVAIAADLPSRKAPVEAPAPAPMWTGFYAGLNAGGVVGHSSVSSYGTPIDPWAQPNNESHSAPPYYLPASIPWTSTAVGLALANYGSAGINQAGVIGGLQFGYNKQFNDKFVAGLEADFQGSSLSGNSGFTSAGTDYLNNAMGAPSASIRNTTLRTEISSGVNWFGTVRGKIGYLLTPQILTYATAGLTYGGVYANVQNYGASSFNSYTAPPVYGGVMAFAGYTPIYGNKGQQTNVLVGWNAGAGAEWMFAQNWSAKAEAFYYNLGSWNLPSTVYGASKWSIDSLRYPLWVSSNTNKINYDGIVARLGVNYHFNLANVVPAVAKF